MSDIVELDTEVARDLATNGIGVFATTDPDTRTIFVGDLPATTNEAIYILTSPSPQPKKYVDTEYHVLDFWARSPSSVNAKALLRKVYELYHGRYGFVLGKWSVYYANALGQIQDVDRDENGGKLVRLSIQFTVRNLNHVS